MQQKVDTSKLVVKFDLASLKAKVDKIDIEKLKDVLVNLSKISNVVNNAVVKKKTVYHKLVKKVIYIGTSGFLNKTKYDTDKSDLVKEISDADGKIPDTCGLVKKQIIMIKLAK